jgi:hypothetical protein
VSKEGREKDRERGREISWKVLSSSDFAIIFIKEKNMHLRTCNVIVKLLLPVGHMTQHYFHKFVLLLPIIIYAFEPVNNVQEKSIRN